MAYYGSVFLERIRFVHSFCSNMKTLAASFKQTSVLTLLERNHQTYCAQNSLLLDDTLSIKEKITQVLDRTALGSERAGKCSEGDFLKLLHAFREENLYFC